MLRIGVALLTVAAAAALSACSSSSAPSTAPTTPPTSTTLPALSKFEGDPAVMVYRQWAAQVGRAVNARNFHLEALSALQTKGFTDRIDGFLADERGHYYPGPLPFTPVRITVQGQYKVIDMCVVDTGYALDARTRKRLGRPHVQGYVAMAKSANGRWLVASFVHSYAISCTGVKVVRQSWPTAKTPRD